MLLLRWNGSLFLRGVGQGSFLYFFEIERLGFAQGFLIRVFLGDDVPYFGSLLRFSDFTLCIFLHALVKRQPLRRRRKMAVFLLSWLVLSFCSTGGMMSPVFFGKGAYCFGIFVILSWVRLAQEIALIKPCSSTCLVMSFHIM